MNMVSEKDFGMDEPRQIGALDPGHPLKLWQEGGCPECEESSCLRALICELLYKNQILRFDLIWAQEQLREFSLRVAKGS